MRMTTVTITECGGNHRTWTSRHRTTDERTARRRAIRKVWGQRAGFWQDSGLPYGYGQIIEPGGQNSSRCLTGRVWISIEEA